VLVHKTLAMPPSPPDGQRYHDGAGTTTTTMRRATETATAPTTTTTALVSFGLHVSKGECLDRALVKAALGLWDVERSLLVARQTALELRPSTTRQGASNRAPGDDESMDTAAEECAFASVMCSLFDSGCVARLRELDGVFQTLQDHRSGSNQQTSDKLVATHTFEHIRGNLATGSYFKCIGNLLVGEATHGLVRGQTCCGCGGEFAGSVAHDGNVIEVIRQAPSLAGACKGALLYHLRCATCLDCGTMFSPYDASTGARGRAPDTFMAVPQNCVLPDNSAQPSEEECKGEDQERRGGDLNDCEGVFGSPPDFHLAGRTHALFCASHWALERTAFECVDAPAALSERHHSNSFCSHDAGSGQSVVSNNTDV
jgi:hypothetical protein